MQMDHILPTMPLTEKETMLERVAHSMAAWRRDIIALLPTRKLAPQAFETRQTGADEAAQEYEAAFTIRAVELSYWEHQMGL